MRLCEADAPSSPAPVDASSLRPVAIRQDRRRGLLHCAPHSRSVSTVYRHVISGLASACLVLVSGMSAADDTAGSPRYPAAPRGTTVDVLHGTPVADPYRWMENGDRRSSRPGWRRRMPCPNRTSTRSAAREALKKRLTELWNYEQYGYSWLDESRACQSRRAAATSMSRRPARRTRASCTGQTRSMRRPRSSSTRTRCPPMRPHRSPTTRSARTDATWPTPSRDGGTDWDTWHVREVETGRDLPD